MWCRSVHSSVSSSLCGVLGAVDLSTIPPTPRPLPGEAPPGDPLPAQPPPTQELLLWPF